ncbi:MAG TPA: RDD family protein [Bacillales bacterium]|nr:RDD family protein [Bacillales bacterium]
MKQELEEIKTPEFVSLQFRLAGIGSRATAMIIDQLILTTVNVLLLVFLFLLYDQYPAEFIGSDVPIAIFLILQFVLYWGYFFMCEFFFAGKTIGKRWVGIRVIQQNGHSITLLSGLIRNLLRIVDMLPFAYLLGMIIVFFHGKQQRLGDMAAGTMVVYERKAKLNHSSRKIEKEILRKAQSVGDLSIEERFLQTLDKRDWQLIKTYSDRLLQLPAKERQQLTNQVAAILFPKVGIDFNASRPQEEVENLLLALYVRLKNEWAYSRF